MGNPEEMRRRLKKEMEKHTKKMPAPRPSLIKRIMESIKRMTKHEEKERKFLLDITKAANEFESFFKEKLP